MEAPAEQGRLKGKQAAEKLVSEETRRGDEEQEEAKQGGGDDEVEEEDEKDNENDGDEDEVSSCDSDKNSEVEVVRAEPEAEEEDGADAEGPSGKKTRIAELMKKYTVTMMSGASQEVSVPATGVVGNIEAKLALEHGWCVSLIGAGGQELNNPSAPLPAESDLQCIVENASQLCAKAQAVLERATPNLKTRKEDTIRLDQLRLGSCHELGSFKTKYWKKDPRMLEGCCGFGSYHVVELTLVDGADKRKRLIGVINDGDADANTGMWGSIYLRPELGEVGGIVSVGDTESKWEISDESWYTNPTVPVRNTSNALCGGGENAETPLQKHLAQALKAAFYPYDPIEE